MNCIMAVVIAVITTCKFDTESEVEELDGIVSSFSARKICKVKERLAKEKNKTKAFAARKSKQ